MLFLVVFLRLSKAWSYMIKTYLLSGEFQSSFDTFRSKLWILIENLLDTYTFGKFSKNVLDGNSSPSNNWITVHELIIRYNQDIFVFIFIVHCSFSFLSCQSASG